MRERALYAFGLLAAALLLISTLHFISVSDIYFKKYGFSRHFFTGSPLRVMLEDLGLPYDRVLVKNGRMFLYKKDQAYLSVRRAGDGVTIRFRRLATDRSCTASAPFIFFNADGENLCFFAPADSLLMKYDPGNDAVSCLQAPFSFDRGIVSGGDYYFKVVDPATRYPVIRQCDSSFNCRTIYVLDTLDNGGLPGDGMFETPRDGEWLYAFYFRNHYLHRQDGRVERYPAITTDTAQTPVVTSGTGTYYFAGPVRAKNIRISSSAGRLYIQSLTVSDNESRTAFRDHVIIDIYDLKDHRYLGTIAVPNRVEGEPISDFSVDSGRIYALYSRFLSVYKIPHLP